MRRLLLGALLTLFLALSNPMQGATLAATGSTQTGALSVQAVPSVIPADGGTYPSLVVSLLSASNQLTVALRAIQVQITLATPGIATLGQTSVLIPQGKTYVIVNVTTTANPGSTEVTATSSGLTSGKATINTAVPSGYPTRVSLTAVPDTTVSTNIFNGVGQAGTLIVGLTDEFGLPAKSVAQTRVSLVSSNTKILNLTSPSIVLNPGDYLIETSFLTGFVPGVAQVSAFASGLTSTSVAVTVMGQLPAGLKLFAQPSPIIQSCGGNSSGCKGRLAVMLVDLSGNPARAPRDWTVQLRSSVVGVISVPLAVTIPKGETFVLTSFQANLLSSSPGSAEITASSPGLSSAFTDVDTYRPGSGPSSLLLYVGPNPILADHESYSSVVIALQDTQARPSATSTPISVTLTSSRIGIGNFSSLTLVIPAGSSYVATTVTSTFLVGSTILTASANNFRSVQSSLSTSGAVPAKVTVSAIVPNTPADGLSHPALKLSLQDTFGEPAIAPAIIPVYLLTTRGDIASVPNVAVIPAGSSSVIVPVTTTALTGSANITALTTGLDPDLPYLTTISSTIVQTFVPPPSQIGAQLVSQTAFLLSGSSQARLAIQLQDTSGAPASAKVATTVQISSSDASVVNASTSATFQPGQDMILVQVIPVGEGTTVLTVTGQGLSPDTVSLRIGLPDLEVQAVAGPSDIYTSNKSVITASVSLDGQPIQGAQVLWRASGGSLSPTTSTTGPNGLASSVFQSGPAGTWTETAMVTVPGLGTFDGTATVQVNTPPAPQKGNGGLQELLFYIFFVAMIVVAAVLVILALRNRRSGVEDIEYDDMMDAGTSQP